MEKVRDDGVKSAGFNNAKLNLDSNLEGCMENPELRDGYVIANSKESVKPVRGGRIPLDIKSGRKRAGLQGSANNKHPELNANRTCCDNTSNCYDTATSCCDSESSCSDTTPSCCDSHTPSCCDNATVHAEKWITGFVPSSIGPIPQISTKLSSDDHLGTIKTRLGIGRMKYLVQPGIYAIGMPDTKSPVLVTANYKLTFDVVRKSLSGENLWLLVLDTKGVNVWCAAGKGTFGTKELVHRIINTQLKAMVAHNTIILPQLGATGVAAHEITRQTGFKVQYGPVRIQDVHEYLINDNKATRQMRQVRFPFIDRVVLTPIEMFNAMKTALPVLGILFLLNLVLRNDFGWIDFYAYIGSLFCGCVLTPALLPWIPGRAFAWKGFVIGLVWVCGIQFLNGWPDMPVYGLARTMGYFMLLPSVSAYYAMTFTGSSTYTSLSGVQKEMRLAIPILLSLSAIGAVLLLINGFGVL